MATHICKGHEPAQAVAQQKPASHLIKQTCGAANLGDEKSPLVAGNLRNLLSSLGGSGDLQRTCRSELQHRPARLDITKTSRLKGPGK
jgi:hypothetical protein